MGGGPTHCGGGSRWGWELADRRTQLQPEEQAGVREGRGQEGAEEGGEQHQAEQPPQAIW